MKGISPLIAAVMLMAFTVAIATLIMGWYSSTARSTTSSITNHTTAAVGCADARLSIQEVFIKANESAYVTVVIQNTGFGPINIEDVQIFNRTGHNTSTGFEKVLNFQKGQIANIKIENASITNCPADFSKVVATSNCGGVTDTFDKTPKCT
jgi:flagellin-like protein